VLDVVRRRTGRGPAGVAVDDEAGQGCGVVVGQGLGWFAAAEQVEAGRLGQAVEGEGKVDAVDGTVPGASPLSASWRR